MLEFAVFAAAATVRRCVSNGLAHFLLMVSICGVVALTEFSILVAGLMGFAEMDNLAPFRLVSRY